MSGFSVRIKSLRELVGLTSEEFARILGIGAGTLNSYERGITTPSGKKIIQISERTGKSIEWLLTGEGKEQKPATVASFPDAEKTQQAEIITSQAQKTGDVAGFSPDSSLVEQLLHLHEEYGAAMRDMTVQAREMTEQARELADLRVEAERLKMELERRERAAAELEREISTLQRRLACYESPGGAAHPTHCSTGPAATAPGAAGSRPGLEGAIVPPAPGTATAPDE